MEASPAKTRAGRAGGWPILVALLAAGPLLYDAGLRVASIAGDVPVVRTVALVGAAVGAILLVVVVPWLFGTLAVGRIEGVRATAGAWSLAVNSAGLVLVCLLLRNTVGIGRGWFLAVWLAWTVLLLVLAGELSRCAAELGGLCRRWGMAAVIGLTAAVVGAGLLHSEHFLQCFNGDGTEFEQLAQSLRHHLLPYWEIEAAQRPGTFVANPTVINSYWTLALQLALGSGEAATRLPCWVWWLGIFAVSLRIVQGEQTRAAWLAAVPLALAMLLVGVWYTFYVGYYPYMADPANPGVPDALFTLLLLLGWDCLRRGDCWGWGASMVLASLVFYAGVVMFVLTVAAVLLWQPVPRGRFLRTAIVTALVLLGIFCGYLVVGWCEGSLPGWWSTLHREVFDKYSHSQGVIPFDSPWLFGLLFAGYFLLGCGGIPAVGLLWCFFRRKQDGDADTRWDRSLASVTLVYLLIVLASGHKNLHYLGPLLPVPLVLWLKCRPGRSAFGPGRWAASLTAAAGLAAAIWLCWPVSREPPFTLNRYLGGVTTFQTDSRHQACRWARMAGNLYDHGYLGWQIGEHTWVGYSELEGQPQPAEPRPLLVTDRSAPPKGQGYELLFGPVAGVRLYSRDPELTDRIRQIRPPAGPHRCAWVFRPIAVRPRVPEPGSGLGR